MAVKKMVSVAKDLDVDTTEAGVTGCTHVLHGRSKQVNIGKEADAGSPGEVGQTVRTPMPPRTEA